MLSISVGPATAPYLVNSEVSGSLASRAPTRLAKAGGRWLV